MSSLRKIMIVAGEASGDAHAAKLVNELKSAIGHQYVRFFGSAGPEMRKAGVEAVVRADGLSIVGLAEIGRALPMFLRAYRDLRTAAEREKPDVAVLVDFPDFNLKLAKTLKRQGIKVVYYISPQIWAWRPYRIKTIRNCVDLVLAILPFEKEWYATRGVMHIEYVGSPLAREVHPSQEKAEFCARHKLDSIRPIVSLLPGSRHKEIVRILPVMIEAASLMTTGNADIQFLIALSSDRQVGDAETLLDRARKSGLRLSETIRIVVNDTYNALFASDAAAVTSGTATLETGIIGTPMAIVYKTSAINYALLEPLISVDHYGLINLIAEKRIAKELIQADFTPEALAKELKRLLLPEVNSSTRVNLNAAVERLGHGGASKRAADAILRLIRDQV